MTRRDALKASLGALAGTFIGAQLAAGGEWPASYFLEARLPQPADRPIENPYGINYWIERNSVTLEFTHVGNGFYVHEGKDLECRAIMERRDGKLLCNKVTCD
jgi:hypothetical protein